MLYTAPLTLHRDAAGDLKAIKAESEDTAAKIVALLRQLKADPDLTGKLLDHGFGARRTEDFSVSRWLDLWNKGIDLWRLKDWNLESHGLKYRIIYLYLRKEVRFVVMAIVKREELNYDDRSHHIRRRVLDSIRADYDI